METSRERRPPKHWRGLKFPGAVALIFVAPLIGVVATLLFWRAAVSLEQEQIHRFTNAETSRVVSWARDFLRQRAENSLRSAGRWLLDDPEDRGEWNYDVFSRRLAVPEVVTVEWVGPDLQSRWWPLDSTAPVVPEVVPLEYLQQAVVEHRVVMFGPLALPDGNVAAATIVPIERGGELAGWVVTLYDLGMVFRAALAGTGTGFAVVVTDDGREIFARYGTEHAPMQEWGHTVEVGYDELTVDLLVEPTAATVESFRLALPRLVLGGGLFGSLVLVLVIGLARVSRLRTAEAQLTGTLQSEARARRRAERALEHKVRELSRSNREFERFGYAISHDIRDPLNAIALNLQVVLDDPDGDVGSDDRGRLEAARRGVSRIDDMLGRLLRYSSVGRGGDELDLVDVAEIIEDAMANLQALIEEHDATVAWGQLPRVIAYRAQLTRLFQNLLSNAVKYRSSEAPQVTVECHQGDDEWTFSVSDNGSGMGKKQIERAFELFWRPDTAADDGSGIGLAICKRIVELHGGRMWVESTPGEGTTFFFTLPSNPGPAAASAAADGE